jgi:DNA primase
MNILDLAHQAGIQPKWVASTHGGEYHSACPSCGGKDRFYIQPHRKMNKCFGYFGCRQCNIYGDTLKFAQQFLDYSFREAQESLSDVLVRSNQIIFFPQSAPTILQKPSVIWINQATELVTHAHQQLLNNNDLITYLHARGLTLEAVKQYRFGWIDKDHRLSRSQWGLHEELKEDGSLRNLWIPQGLLIPSFANSEVVRLKIRRQNWKDGDQLPKYVAVSGSMNGLNIVGSLKRRTIVVVESELDAYALDYAVGDLVCAIAVGSNMKNPDNISDRLAKNASQLLICHDNDDAGGKMYRKWKKLYTHATGCTTPIGKDIGEAIQRSLNIRDWLTQQMAK